MLKKIWDTATGWKFIEDIYGVSRGANEAWMARRQFNNARLAGAVLGLTGGFGSAVMRGGMSSILIGAAGGWFVGGWAKAVAELHLEGDEPGPR